MRKNALFSASQQQNVSAVFCGCGQNEFAVPDFCRTGILRLITLHAFPISGWKFHNGFLFRSGKGMCENDELFSVTAFAGNDLYALRCSTADDRRRIEAGNPVFQHRNQFQIEIATLAYQRHLCIIQRSNVTGEAQPPQHTAGQQISDALQFAFGTQYRPDLIVTYE